MAGLIHRFPWATDEDAQVMIAQYGSKSTPLIAQLCREVGLRSRIVRWEQLGEVWRKQTRPPHLVILSGGDQSVYDADAPGMDPDLYRAITRESVILGICYGAQLLAKLGGGEVRPAAKPEFGFVQSRCQQLGGYQGGEVVMNHRDEIVRMPADWAAVGSTPDCANAVCVSPRVVAVQFHPEMDHTEDGDELLKHVAFKLADCRKDYQFKPAQFIAEAERWLAEVAPGGNVLCGASGGVDSSVTLTLARAAYKRRIHGIFVDNGFMRENEAEEVRGYYGDAQMSYVDARETFYAALEAIPYPADGAPEKNEAAYYKAVRAMNGRVFIETFIAEGRRLGAGFQLLMQGTNVSDIVETETGLKDHHNTNPLVKRLIEEFGVDIIEPLAGLYKFEIREVARKLGLPEAVSERQPFPGPGLSLRTFGKIDRTIFPVLARANKILDEVMAEHYPTYGKRPCQYYVAFAPLASTGIMGDGRVSGFSWALRMVTSRKRENYSSLDNFIASKKFYRDLTRRLTAETKMPNGTPFCRVYQEMTGKPPSTTEPH